MMRRILFFLAMLVIFLSGCAKKVTVQATQTAQPTGKLTPYLTVTPSPAGPTTTIEVTIPVTPTPTPTPFLYSVKGNDTMLSIAYQFGITLEELQAANPTVDPHYMGEGLKLVIPISTQAPEDLATPTAVAVDASVPTCYRSGDGGAWCVVAIKNDLEYSLENLSAWIGLFDNQGNNFTSQSAYAPMNILHPGSTMPLMAFFKPPLPNQFEARSQVTGALEVAQGDNRYIDAQASINSTEISQDGGHAVVSGEVSLPEGSPRLSQLWVLAVAYDVDGNIVGARKWKSDGETSFEIPVYSLARAIEHVEVLVEARP